MSCRRSSFAIATALPLEDEDLLREILLRLPSQPSSLPRASAVCKRWRSILSDDVFLRRFRRHHWKPPLLGFFKGDVYTGYHFTSVMDSLDRIPAARFSLPVPMPKGIIPYNERWNLMGCRHGLAVLVNLPQREIVVLDPLSRQQYHVTCPPGLMLGQDYIVCCHAAVVCADNEDGHVHGDCFSRPLKLVFIWVTENLQDTHTQAFACLYESVSGLWGDISSMECTYEVYDIGPSVHVENALCWLLFGSDILVFDLQSQSLSVIKKPIDTDSSRSVQLLRTDDGGLGLAYLSELTIQLWERKSNRDGVVRWVLLQKTIQLEELFPQGMFNDFKTVLITGYDEDINVIILSVVTGVFMLQLDSVQIKHIIKTKYGSW